MDSKIKEELIDEIQQLDIKKKDEDFVSIMAFHFAGFQIASANIESNVAGDVIVDDVGMTITDISLANNVVYNFLHVSLRFCLSRPVPDDPIICTLEEIKLRAFDINHHPFALNCTLVLNFSNWGQANAFGQRLLEVGYTQI